MWGFVAMRDGDGVGGVVRAMGGVGAMGEEWERE